MYSLLLMQSFPELWSQSSGGKAGNIAGFWKEPCDANPKSPLLTTYNSFSVCQHRFISESSIMLLIYLCPYSCVNSFTVKDVRGIKTKALFRLVWSELQSDPGLHCLNEIIKHSQVNNSCYRQHGSHNFHFKPLHALKSFS